MKILALMLMTLPLAASAATLTVNTTADNLVAGDGKCSLREAIANVNAAADTTGQDCAAGSGGGDSIKFAFAMPATIRLRLGQLRIQHDVSLLNPAPGSLHLDAAHRTRVFEIAAGTTSMVNLTIEHGKADNGGGAMVDSGATLSLARSALTDNIAGTDDDKDFLSGYGGGIYSAGTLNLTACRLLRNKASSPFGSVGGGIANTGGTVALTDCTLAGNTADTEGGAIFSGSGTVTLIGCTLHGNKAASADYPSYGGGIFNDSDSVATLTNCALTRNKAITGGDSYTEGGGIFNVGSITLNACTLSRNVAWVKDLGEAFGAGIGNDGVLAMSDSTITGNVALSPGPLGGAAFGGGISNGESIDFEGPSSVTLRNCTLDRNRSVISRSGNSSGGGVANGGSMTMTNCTLVGNRSSACSIFDCSSSGGAIYSEGDATLTNCTLSHNTAQRPIGENEDGYGGAINNAHQITLTNSIVAHSGSSRNCVDSGGYGLTSAGHNISSDGTCFAGGGTDLLHTNPQLGAFGDYGGPTRTLPLCTGPGSLPKCRAASPAIDAGDDSVTIPPDNLSTDQRGVRRLSGPHVDIGAYEAQ